MVERLVYRNTDLCFETWGNDREFNVRIESTAIIRLVGNRHNLGRGRCLMATCCSALKYVPPPTVIIRSVEATLVSTRRSHEALPCDSIQGLVAP
jgi:hypothetical protein